MGAPIPFRRKPDGVRTSVGSRVRFRETTVGFLWSEWEMIQGERCELMCRQLAGSHEVTRAMLDTAAAAFLLASEWAANLEFDDELYIMLEPTPPPDDMSR